MQKRFKGVVFDMDGVVIDTEKLVLDCWNETGMKHGLPDMSDVLKQCIGLNSKDTDDLIMANFGDQIEDLELLRSERRELVKRCVEEGKVLPKPHIPELLAYLKENGYKTALATSTSRRSAVHELDILDLTRFFDVIVTGDEINNGKPAPDIFLKACEKLGEDPSSLIGVEDSYNGIRSCHSAGLYTVMVPDLLPPTDEMRDLADEIFDSAAGIFDLL
ncbi:MAG: HAD family phosphatase [Saccharofermentans sp.]|nr:HAD family phosphatase [Saccharofermentans sp.]